MSEGKKQIDETNFFFFFYHICFHSGVSHRVRVTTVAGVTRLRRPRVKATHLHNGGSDIQSFMWKLIESNKVAELEP